MKILCVSVGKKHDKDLAVAIERYEKRLKKHCDFSWQIIPTSNVDTESSAIERVLKTEDYVVLLDEHGVQLNNQQVAEQIETVQNEGQKRLVIVIGGAYGVNHQLMTRANLTLSLSPLVLPHQIVRLLIVEQLYRTYSIMSGGKYHHQ
jgi:23S rRNA (pseudouridine1915-N3)-methyltransferase